MNWALGTLRPAQRLQKPKTKQKLLLKLKKKTKNNENLGPNIFFRLKTKWDNLYANAFLAHAHDRIWVPSRQQYWILIKLWLLLWSSDSECGLILSYMHGGILLPCLRYFRMCTLLLFFSFSNFFNFFMVGSLHLV